jgi:hypothetical protein
MLKMVLLRIPTLMARRLPSVLCSHSRQAEDAQVKLTQLMTTVSCQGEKIAEFLLEKQRLGEEVLRCDSHYCYCCSLAECAAFSFPTQPIVRLSVHDDQHP